MMLRIHQAQPQTRTRVMHIHLHMQNHLNDSIGTNRITNLQVHRHSHNYLYLLLQNELTNTARTYLN